MAKNIIFNVTKPNTFVNDQFGELTIEEEIYEEEFIMEFDDDLSGLDDIYKEADFLGDEEFGQMLEKQEIIKIEEFSEPGIEFYGNDSPNGASTNIISSEDEMSAKFPNDTDYIRGLKNDQKNNIEAIVKGAKSMGITNKYFIAAMIAIASKESNIRPVEESGKYSDPVRIRKTFGKRTQGREESLTNNSEKLFNVVYSNIIGNGSEASGDGFRYRGRGFNQITGKANYESYGKQIGENLVTNPELMTKAEVAAKVFSQYNKSRIYTLIKLGKNKIYNFTNINDFKNARDAYMAVYNMTAGEGKNIMPYLTNDTSPGTPGGFTKGMRRVLPILAYLEENNLV